MLGRGTLPIAVPGLDLPEDASFLASGHLMGMVLELGGTIPSCDGLLPVVGPIHVSGDSSHYQGRELLVQDMGGGEGDLVDVLVPRDL